MGFRGDLSYAGYSTICRASQRCPRRGSFIGGGICSYGERCPPKCPLFKGGVLRIPKYKALPDIGFSANKLADVSDVSDGVHTSIPTIGAYLALKRLCFWRARPPPSPIKVPLRPRGERLAGLKSRMRSQKLARQARKNNVQRNHNCRNDMDNDTTFAWELEFVSCTTETCSFIQFPNDSTN